MKTIKMKAINQQTLRQKLRDYRRHPFSFILFLLVSLATVITVGILIFLIAYILIMGIPNLSLDLFAWEYNSENVSMMPAIINTLTMTLLSLLIAVPLGIFSAIYLVEYAKRGNKLVSLVRITAETLSGIPSIVYGLFGFLLFGMALDFGYSLLSGALTLSIMILPLIMRTTEEALKAVPDTYREGSFGLGPAGCAPCLRSCCLRPCRGSWPGIILAIGRIVGETAALIYTSGTVTGIPDSLMGSGRTLSVHMYALWNEGLNGKEAYATAVVLLILVVGINALSGFVAKKVGTRDANG